MKTYDYEQLLRGLVYAIYDEYTIDQGNAKEDTAEFFKWLGDIGWTIAEKILESRVLDEQEEQFSWIATGVCIWRADKCIWRDDQGDELSDEDKRYLEYGRKLQKDGTELIIRGYWDKDLSDKDWKRLHEYRVFLQCCILFKGDSWPRQAGIGLYEFGSDALRPPLGIKMPNLTLPYVDDFYESRDYTDAPADYFAFMKPKCLDEFKNMFDAFEPKKDETGRHYVIAKPAEIPENIKSWCVDDIKTTGKPTILILTASMDCFWARAGALLEHIYRAYKNVIDIKWVEMDVLDWLIRGDTTYNHFSPNAGLEEPGHAISYEDRARLVKKLYMTHPHCTFPCLLDDPGDTIANYFRSGGGSGIFAVIDVDGNLAGTSNECGWGYYFGNRPPQRGCCDQFPWVNKIELAILDIIGRNGKTNPELFQKEPDKTKPKNETGKKQMYLIQSRIESIDKENRVLYIVGRPSVFSVVGHSADQKMYFNDPHKMTIHVPEDVKILCKNVPVSFDFLNAGDVILGPGFTWIDTLTWEASTINVSKPEGGGDSVETVPDLFKGTTYLLGKIVDINSDAKTLTIKPDMDEGRGQKFIAQAGDKLDLQGRAATNWAAYQKWLARGDKPVSLTLHDDTLVYRHGVLAELSGCEMADQVCVWYDDAEAGNDTIRAAIIISSEIQ